jgi:hypothetical protein
MGDTWKSTCFGHSGYFWAEFEEKPETEGFQRLRGVVVAKPWLKGSIKGAWSCGSYLEYVLSSRHG